MVKCALNGAGRIGECGTALARLPAAWEDARAPMHTANHAPLHRAVLQPAAAAAAPPPAGRPINPPSAGRLAFRIAFDSCPELELVHINEPSPIESTAYLLKYDSVHGEFVFVTRPSACPEPAHAALQQTGPPHPPHPAPPQARGRTRSRRWTAAS